MPGRLEIKGVRRSGGHVHPKSELYQEFSTLNERFSTVNHTKKHFPKPKHFEGDDDPVFYIQ